MQAQAPRRYETLDALRGVAAFGVLLLHTQEHLWPGLATSAYLAVDFFFILSGFVVAHAYDARLGQGLSVAGFLKLRAVRLYPLHMAGLLIGAAVAAAAALSGEGRLTGAEVALSVVLGCLFLPSPAMGGERTLFPLNGPAWSLFFEMAANVGYGATHRWLTTPLIGAGAVLSAAALGVLAAHAGTINAGASFGSIEAGFVRAGFGFSMGVLLHRCRDRIPAALGRLGPWPLLALMLALCLPTVPAPWRAAYDLAVVLVAAPLLVAAGVRAAPSVAARPAFLVLGAISFPLYALHAPLEDGMVAAAEALGLAGPAAGLAYVAAMPLIAWAAVPLDAAARQWLLAHLAGPAPSAS